MTAYISTRGPGAPQSFLHVLLSGMAPDGGLYIPDSWPELDRSLLEHMSGLPYASVALQILRPFIGKAIDEATLQKILSETYEDSAFDHSAIAPLIQIGPNAWMLELFHGPTLSFKDYAMQLLGRMFDQILAQQGSRLTILGATSGDTGSAAIEACRNCRNIDIFILHPKGRTSEVQRRQMTAVDAPNVFNIAIEGTFDDCQAIVKTLFADEKLRGEMNLSAVNSINWARIMAQTIYYTVAALALGAPGRPVSFAVPTGNFGNIYAAWAAKRIGVPINKLVIGTNRNDILTRFFETGEMKAGPVTPSLSPSMDIQVSSNFERYLCDLVGRDHKMLRGLMEEFRLKRYFALDKKYMERARADFQAYRCSDEETIETMRACHKQTGIIIDPHTAVGLNAAMQAVEKDPATPMIVLGCAHPAKFPEAVKQATGIEPPLPPHLAALMKKPEFYTPMPNDAQRVKSFMKSSMNRG